MSAFLFISPEQHFSEALKEALEQRRVKSFPYLETYLVHMLKHYLDSRNLFTPQSTHGDSNENPPQTLAEMYLVAMNSEASRRKDIMKTLSDRSLYLAGFFGDSLQKKLVDIDYYSEMGSAAYLNLASWTKEDHLCAVYRTFSKRFLEFVEVLSYMSEKSAVQADQNVLRLYDKYLKTGSEVAREKLTQMGIVTLSKEQLKNNKA
jgi:hypothetical protein